MLLDTDNRRARADGIRAGLTSKELQRFEDAKNKLLIHWAALYGDRLNPLVIENMSAESLLNMDILEAVHGNPPQSEESWRAIAMEIATGDEWVTRNLEFSDAKLKAEIRDRVLSELPGARRMAMQRSGELDGYVASAVQEELEARCSQRAV